ncbi:MAG: 3-oxoacyl-ACP synthase [Deltaproteobacteria bacterium]|nr:MAG: 3-oxoacyl-ACP synthase [Deltaproteobacteria bacterium]
MTIGISGFGHFLPETEIANEQLVAHFGMDISPSWIVDKTGIKKRHFVGKDENNSDLADRASQMAIRDAGLSVSDIDGLVLATSSPDYVQPPTSCVVHGKLGLKDAFAFDVMSVCSGFVFAFSVAHSLLKSNPVWNHILVVASETYSRLVSFEDPKSSVLFGDGAGAVVLSRGGSGEIVSFHLHTEGSGQEKIIVRSGGVAERITSAAVASDRHLFSMDGKSVADFVFHAFAKASEYFGFNSHPKIDFLIPHQANVALLHSASEKNGIPWDRMIVDMEEVGNTSSASIPITLSRAWHSGKIRRGMRIGLFGFGGGLSYGMVELSL